MKKLLAEIAFLLLLVTLCLGCMWAGNKIGALAVQYGSVPPPPPPRAPAVPTCWELNQLELK